jgi:tetratricopeptide (TPR) repeat protein
MSLPVRWHEALVRAVRDLGNWPDSLEVAMTLDDRAAIAERKGQFRKAESLFSRALAIKEKVLGPDHPELAPTLNNLALFHKLRGDFTEAAVMYGRCLAILQNSVEPDHPFLVVCAKNLESLRGDQAVIQRLHRSVREATA